MIDTAAGGVGVVVGGANRLDLNDVSHSPPAPRLSMCVTIRWSEKPAGRHDPIRIVLCRSPTNATSTITQYPPSFTNLNLVWSFSSSPFADCTAKSDGSLRVRSSSLLKRPPPPLISAPHLLALRHKTKDLWVLLEDYSQCLLGVNNSLIERHDPRAPSSNKLYSSHFYSLKFLDLTGFDRSPPKYPTSS